MEFSFLLKEIRMQKAIQQFKLNGFLQ